MKKIRYTKNALRDEEKRLLQLQNYLPTLKLKKKLLQFEINETRVEIKNLREKFDKTYLSVEDFVNLFSENKNFNIFQYVEVKHVSKYYENIAGIDIPKFESIIFQKDYYSLFDTPIWADSGIKIVRELVIFNQKLKIVEEKKRILLNELNEISIRVNLFEKVLIPRAKNIIKKIKIFLSDQELASVSRAKVAKNKIILKRVS
ncbi:MAG: ATP synthase subunit D [Chlamydiae bacterium SM23_39]|nr:MAG: ATP synthase subunit D [Chlamydiae bacterium SM23_39]